MNVSDGERDLAAQLLLVELHAHDLVGEPLVEEPVDLGSAGELQRVDSGGPASLDGTLEVLLQLLDAPTKRKRIECSLIFAERKGFWISLEHGLGLDGGVVRPEVLVLLDLLLEGQVLLLEAVAQARQRLADVVRELLVQHLLQVGRAEAVGHVAVARVGEEELPLGGHGGLDVLLAVDVLLRAVDHAHVAPAQGEQLVLEDVAGVGALVHQVELGQDADRTQT